MPMRPAGKKILINSLLTAIISEKEMKKVLVLLIIILSVNYQIDAQEKPKDKGSIQLNYGLSQTLHYRQPVGILACFEGCFPSEQKARVARSMELGYYYKLNNRHELKMGTGFSEYKFWESGLASDGGNTFNPYEWIVNLYYLDMSLGYRYTLSSHHKINTFLESHVSYELLSKMDYVLKSGSYAATLRGGCFYNINERVTAITSIGFKSGIVRFNKKGMGNSYIPFGYGLELGLAWRFR